MHNFSKNFSYLLTVNDLTQVDFSKQIGIERTTITNYKNGVSTPDYDKIIKIAKYFDISIDELLISDLKKKNPKENAVLENEVDYVLVPMFDAIAYGGDLRKGKSFDESITEIGTLKLSQQFKGATGAMFIRDDSMYPLYPNSCVVVFKTISDISIIAFGRDYIIETEDYRLVKRILKAKNKEYLIASSINTEVWEYGEYKGTPIYEAFELPKNKLLKLDLVLGKL